MKRRIAIMLDGGHLPVHARRASLQYTPDLIRRIAPLCALAGEGILRIMYYDCAPFTGATTLPVSGQQQIHTGNVAWLRELSRLDLFAVRLGELKFRGYVLDKRGIPLDGLGPLKDSDFVPHFEQKGVDMRIGLDMAGFAANRSVELIAIATNDTDCIPAMKHVRRAGLQVAMVVLPGYRPAPDLLSHADFVRRVAWPSV